MNHQRKLTHDKNQDITSFSDNCGPMFGRWSLSVYSNNTQMNSDKNCFGYTGGGPDDRFNTPVDANGFSILTGMSKGGSN